MRTLENEFGQIGNDIGLANSNPPLQTFDVVQPSTTRRTRHQMMPRRGDLESRGFTIEFGRQDLPHRSTSIGDGTKVPRIVRHAR